jgi:hypothetical protein
MRHAVLIPIDDEGDRQTAAVALVSLQVERDLNVFQKGLLSEPARYVTSP